MSLMQCFFVLQVYAMALYYINGTEKRFIATENEQAVLHVTLYLQSKVDSVVR